MKTDILNANTPEKTKIANNQFYCGYIRVSTGSNINIVLILQSERYTINFDIGRQQFGHALFQASV